MSESLPRNNRPLMSDPEPEPTSPPLTPVHSSPHKVYTLPPYFQRYTHLILISFILTLIVFFVGAASIYLSQYKTHVEKISGTTTVTVSQTILPAYAAVEMMSETEFFKFDILANTQFEDTVLTSYTVNQAEKTAEYTLTDPEGNPVKITAEYLPEENMIVYTFPERYILEANPSRRR